MKTLTGRGSDRSGQHVSPDAGRNPLTAPLAAAVHLRQPCAALDTGRTRPGRVAHVDITANREIAGLLRSRPFQFLIILPCQVLFWAVMLAGLLGPATPGLNFGTALTWYVWIALLFALTMAFGRAWCAMCPFGGFAEWIQRRSLWRRTQRALGLGRTFPEPLARYGLLIPVALFAALTWIEEFFNIAWPGTPAATSFMIAGVMVFALAVFLIYERRTFCRYLCPLTPVIGTFGAVAPVEGFRARDPDVCLTCATKDCMRGADDGYGCPWYTWPGSADVSLYCGLCSECFKACPEGNIGLFLQPPGASVTAPQRRRADVAWAVAVLWGIGLYQQINATNPFASLDNWLNATTRFPHYPNPADYLVIIAGAALLIAAAAWSMGALLARRDTEFATAGGFLDRGSRFRSYFLPVAYGLIPLVGANYLARQLPKFFHHGTRLVPAVQQMLGSSSAARSPLFGTAMLSDRAIVAAQVAVLAAGTAWALWCTWRIAGRELAPLSRSAAGARIAALGLVLACGVASAALYVVMQAADLRRRP